MSLQVIHLRKLLQIFYLPDAKRIAVLRADIRTDMKRERGGDTDGGDFHVPFWTDVKSHVRGEADLGERTSFRIERNAGRRRLYPLLLRGFLRWWDERRRWRNEPFEFIEQSVKARLSVPDLGGVVKVENLLSVKVGDQFNRIIYPYFSEEPSLTDESGRIGLWVLSEALTRYPIGDLRILDVLRSRSFSTIDTPLQGNERDLFLTKYESALTEWRRLREEYD